MEDVLELYAEPYDSKRPKVCFDETSKQLIAETKTPLPPRPGQAERYDYEYQRNGTCNLLWADHHKPVNLAVTEGTTPTRPLPSA